jgi:hypothetical protein
MSQVHMFLKRQKNLEKLNWISFLSGMACMLLPLAIVKVLLVSVGAWGHD